MTRTKEGLVLIGKRELFKRVGQGIAFAAVSKLLEMGASADISVDPITEQDAANLYGTDYISRNPAYWRRNDQGGVQFIGTGDGTHYLLMLNGAEANGQMGIVRSDGRNVAPFVAHRNVEKVYAIGATLWRHRNPEDGYNNIFFNTFLQNQTENLMAIRFPLRYVTGDVAIDRVPSQQDAAARFGADYATADWTRWSIGPYGEAIFNGTGDGISHPIILRNAELNGEAAIRKLDGTANVAPVVVHRNIGKIWVAGGTVWPHRDPDAGWQNLLTNTINYYNQNRPGIKLFPVRY